MVEMGWHYGPVLMPFLGTTDLRQDPSCCGQDQADRSSNDSIDHLTRLGSSPTNRHPTVIHLYSPWAVHRDRDPEDCTNLVHRPRDVREESTAPGHCGSCR